MKPFIIFILDTNTPPEWNEYKLLRELHIHTENMAVAEGVALGLLIESHWMGTDDEYLINTNFYPNKSRIFAIGSRHLAMIHDMSEPTDWL